MISTLQAAIIAVWITLIQSRFLFGGATTNLRFSPMMTGLVCGIVLGDVEKAMMITAVIQLLYMGVFAPGGQMPSEPAIAAAVAVPVAILGNLEPEAAIAIAVPVGLLGGNLYQFRLFINSYLNKIADRGIEKLNDRDISKAAIWYPLLVSTLLFFPLMFVTLRFGTEVIADFVNSAITDDLFHVLSVVGGGLVSIGIAVTIYVVGKKNYIVFFLLGYFLCVIFKEQSLPMLLYAIIGAIVAGIFVVSKNEIIDATQGD